MQQSKTKQQGIGLISLLLILAVLGSAAYVGFKLTPAYLEQKKVLFAQESVAAQPEAALKSRSQLEEELLKRLLIDDVKGITRKQLYVTKEGGQWNVRVVYSRQVAILETLDVVLKYDESVLVPR